MKKSILVLIMMVFTAGVYGQEHHKGREHHKRDKSEMMEKMKKHLSLTDQQVVKIQAIHAKYEDQEDALREEMHKLKDQHKALRETIKKEIEQILTPEQQAKIKEMKGKRKGERKGNRKGKGMMRKDLKAKSSSN